jgi:hypothetical protein
MTIAIQIEIPSMPCRLPTGLFLPPRSHPSVPQKACSNRSNALNHPLFPSPCPPFSPSLPLESAPLTRISNSKHRARHPKCKTNRNSTSGLLNKSRPNKPELHFRFVSHPSHHSITHAPRCFKSHPNPAPKRAFACVFTPFSSRPATPIEAKTPFPSENSVRAQTKWNSTSTLLNNITPQQTGTALPLCLTPPRSPQTWRKIPFSEINSLFLYRNDRFEVGSHNNWY